MRWFQRLVQWLHAACTRYLAARGLLSQALTTPATPPPTDPASHRVLTASGLLYQGADFLDAKRHFFQAKGSVQWFQGPRLVREK